MQFVQNRDMNKLGVKKDFIGKQLIKNTCITSLSNEI